MKVAQGKLQQPFQETVTKVMHEKRKKKQKNIVKIKKNRNNRQDS